MCGDDSKKSNKMAIFNGKGAKALVKGRKLFEERKNPKSFCRSVSHLKNKKENVTKVEAVSNLNLCLPETCAAVVAGSVWSSPLLCFHLLKVINFHEEQV